MRRALAGLRFCAVGAVELALFTRFPGAALRPLARMLVRRHVAAAASVFDADFYLRQFAEARRQARVARSPLLHYVLLGWREWRSPAAAFDPTHCERDDLGRSRRVDPLLAHLERERSADALCNEVGAVERISALQPTILTFNHHRGGGSSHFLDLFEGAWRRRGYNVLRIRAVRGAPFLGVIDVRDDHCQTAIVIDLNRPDEVQRLVEQWKVERIVVNHLVERPPGFAHWIRRLSDTTACPYDVLLHDYFVLCPRINLVTGQGWFCDVAPQSTCVTCVAADGSEVTDVDMGSWRATMLDFLAAAGRVIVPSDDVAQRVGRFLDRPYEVWQPEDDSEQPAQREPSLDGAEPLRVVTLGALNVPKGSRVLAALAHQARGTPMTFTVLGPSPETARLEQAGVKVSGAYRSTDIDRLIDAASPHVVFLPAIWPETWSFVLTIALRRGLPVVAFDIGAPAERLRRLGRGHLLPPDLATRPADLLQSFLALREAWIAR